MKFTNKKIKALHRDQSGAVFLLLLAGFLILFMMAMVLYDTGVAGGDKTAVQVSADSAAFSQSVVKARTMNALVYANIIKRMYYSYVATYTTAMTALTAWVTTNIVLCFFEVVPSCKEAVPATLILVSELAEMGKTVLPSFDKMGQEIEALDEHQKYLVSVTPWWSYLESFSRGRQNGAMVTANWPPPPFAADGAKDIAVGWASKVDSTLGSSLIDRFPSVTTRTDALPVEKNSDTDRYCSQYRLSTEHLLHTFQLVTMSDDTSQELNLLWKAALTLVLGAMTTGGCSAANLAFKDQGYLDMRIPSRLSSDKNEWAQSTSNVALAYRPRAGRNDDKGNRKKYGFLKSKDASFLHKALYRNEGYFALARSEIVYKKTDLIPLNFGKLGNEIIGKLTTTQSPDMWSPQWMAKGRPFMMPGESMGASVNGDVGLNTIVNDSLPLLVVMSSIGLATEKNAGLSSSIGDFAYLLRLGAGFDKETIHGISK